MLSPSPGNENQRATRRQPVKRARQEAPIPSSSRARKVFVKNREKSVDESAEGAYNNQSLTAKRQPRAQSSLKKLEKSS